MSENKKQSTTVITSSEINKEVEVVKEDINILENKAEKLAELLGSTVQFAPWDQKSIDVPKKSNSDIEKILAEEKARKAKEAEEAARKAKEAEEAARKAKEAEEAARKAKEAEEAEKARKAKEAEEAAKKIEEVKVTPVVETPNKTTKKPEKLASKKQFVKKLQPKQQTAKQSFTGYFEKVVGVKKISKTTKGGRHMRFSALVVIGDKNGIVGYGKGKSIEVPVAIRKALKNAKNNLRKVKINKNGTLYHEVIGKQGAGKVLIKPAPNGTGIIAGGPIRVVLELAGYKDVYSKNLGKNTSLNMVLATLDGLSKIRTPKEIAYLRDKQLKDL